MMDFLEKHFDTAFDAPDGIKKLRQLILTLAMQGKLVPQDPSDQPASELLKEIQAEKTKLIKEGKIKAQKELPAIKPEEIPYELPKGWEWHRLPDIAFFQEGPGILAKDFRETGIPLIRIAGMHNDVITLDGCNYLEDAMVEKKWSHFRLDVGDIVLSASASLGKVAKTDKNTEGCIVYTGLIRFKPYYVLDDDYLIHFFRSNEFIRQIDESKRGAAIKHFGPTHLQKMIVPLPPLAEQKRIIEKIDQLMARCDELEKLKQTKEQKRLDVHKSAIHRLLNTAEINGSWSFIKDNFNELYSVKENVTELRKAILSLALQGKLVPQDESDQPASELLKEIQAEKAKLLKDGRIKKQKELQPIKPAEIPYRLPKGWEWVRLEELTLLITKGSSPKWQGIDYVDKSKGTLFITSENVGNFKLILNKQKYVEHEFNKISPRSVLCRNDILMNIVGASIGRTAIYDIDERANINQAVTIIRLLEKLYHHYFLYFFNSSTCLSYMFNKQVDNARANLSMGNIALFPIPFPPLAEQKRIVAKIDQLMAMCDELETEIDKAEETQTSLLNSVMA